MTAEEENLALELIRELRGDVGQTGRQAGGNQIGVEGRIEG